SGFGGLPSRYGHTPILTTRGHDPSIMPDPADNSVPGRRGQGSAAGTGVILAPEPRSPARFDRIFWQSRLPMKPSRAIDVQIGSGEGFVRAQRRLGPGIEGRGAGVALPSGPRLLPPPSRTRLSQV